MSNIRKLWYLYKLRKNQWKSLNDLKKLQERKLRAIIRYAYKNVPFYHKKFREANIKPKDIKSVEDLSKLPFTTKEEVREHSLGSMLARGIDLKKCLVTETSGSTGIPTKVVYDEAANDFSKAANLRSYMENGLCFWNKWAVFKDPHHFEEPRWFQKLRIFNQLQLSVFDPTDKHISILRKFKPDVLDGYTSSIRLLAKAVEEERIEEIDPKVVFGTSELLDEKARNYINSVFNVEMIDLFGCVELNRTAWECKEHVGYHMDIDAVVTEFIRDGESVSFGERGEIIYTGLYNYAMPLIRYQVGDIGVPSNEVCPCGRGLPLMKSIEGRTDSFMQVPSGRIFSPIIWTDIMRRIPGIGQFKAIQERKDLIRILFIKNDEFSQKTLSQIEHDIKEVMGEEVNVEVEIVDEIPKDKSGKVRCAISKVSIKW